MTLKIYTVAVALIFSVLSVSAANMKKFNELFDKYDKCYDNNDYRGSVKYLEEALPYIHPDSMICFSATYNGLSYAYWDLGQYDKAVEYGKLCLEYDQQIGDSSRLSRSFNLLAILFTHLKLFDEAERYMLEAINYVAHDDTQMKAGRYAVFGEILSANHKDAEAISYIQKAIALDSAANRTDKIPVRLSQLGTAYMNQKDFAKAERILAQATEGLRATGNNYSLSINLMAQTRNYMALGRKTDAERAVTECLALSNQLNRRKTKLEALHHLAKLRQSPELYEQTLDLSDSLYNEQISQQIADFEVQYATAEKEREKAQLQVTVNRQRYALVVCVIVFLALFIGTVLVYVVRRMRQDIEHTERVARELFVHQSRKARFGKPTPDANPTENITDTEPQTPIAPTKIEEQPIAQQADILPNEPSEPVEEEPDIQLSPREVDIVRACCQGKLSKEIADEFGISKKTVDNHKSAIYQKLGICNNTELILYAVKHGIAKL